MCYHRYHVVNNSLTWSKWRIENPQISTFIPSFLLVKGIFTRCHTSLLTLETLFKLIKPRDTGFLQIF